jgi:hypothetical protein
MTIIKNNFESFYSDIKKARKCHYRVKSWVIFNKGQFTHICQLNVSYGQDSVSGIVHLNILDQVVSSECAIFETACICM